jgi:hypothetical protein
MTKLAEDAGGMGMRVRPLLFHGDGIGQPVGISPVAGQSSELIKPAQHKELGGDH